MTAVVMPILAPIHQPMAPPIVVPRNASVPRIVSLRKCVSGVTNDERPTPPRLRLLRLVLVLELGHDGRIGEGRGVAQRAAFGDVAEEAAHDLARAGLRQV